MQHCWGKKKINPDEIKICSLFPLPLSSARSCDSVAAAKIAKMGDVIHTSEMP